ncbi:hypothetical protein [Micromonospora sp. NPDC048839]|uniref:DUF7574 domain-containing protein n=1 Tax=Micromonospora sp. NPDC048839 TaxID=3155641 RepID=UPI0033E387A2
MIYGNTVKIDDEDFEIVAQAGEYGYDWNIAALLKSPGGGLFYAHASGCSCTSFTEKVTSRGDLRPVFEWQEALEMARRQEHFDTSHLITFAERLRAGAGG